MKYIDHYLINIINVYLLLPFYLLLFFLNFEQVGNGDWLPSSFHVKNPCSFIKLIVSNILCIAYMVVTLEREREIEFVCIHGYFLFLILLTFVELWHTMSYQFEASFHPSRIFPYVILSQFLQHWLFFSNVETYTTFFLDLFDSISCDWSDCGHHKPADLGDAFSFHLLFDAW